MKTAKALYLGGFIIHASDERLNFSYRNLGLRCCYCGEPVLYKSGQINRPHFAHYPDVHPDKMEECLLRQTSQAHLDSWTSLTPQGKQQRLKIFQTNFLKLVTFNIHDFEKCIDSFKENIPLHKVEKLQSFLEDSINYLKSKRRSITLFYRLLQYKKPEISLLQQTIATEALNYLCVQSSHSIFVKMIYYAIYRLQKNKKFLMFKYQECKDICEIIADLIFQADWKAAFCSIPGYIYIEPQSRQEELYQVLKDGYVYIKDRNLIFVREVNRYEFEEYILGAFLKSPNLRYRDKYPYDIQISAGYNLAYRDYKESVELFKANILKTMQNGQEIGSLRLNISKRKRLCLNKNKNKIFISDRKTYYLSESDCLANISFLYHWHTRTHLELKHFFKPEMQYKLFLEFHPEGREALVKLFSIYLNFLGIKTPFSTAIDAGVVKTSWSDINAPVGH